MNNNVGMKFLMGLILLLLARQSCAQYTYTLKGEYRYLKNIDDHFNGAKDFVVPRYNPSWRGESLNGEEGVSLNVINGVEYKDKVFAGVGLGYLNFEGIHGIDAFVELEYIPFTTRIRPLIGFGVGGSHIWNQYDKGTRTASGGLGVGLNINITDKIDIYAKTSLWFSQFDQFVPLSIGVRI